jgi:hypothetical protein
MTTYINQQWLLDKRPTGMPEDDCWKLNEHQRRGAFN